MDDLSTIFLMLSAELGEERKNKNKRKHTEMRSPEKKRKHSYFLCCKKKKKKNSCKNLINTVYFKGTICFPSTLWGDAVLFAVHGDTENLSG